MDTIEQINILKDFIENQYYAELLEQARKGRNYLIIDFSLLAKFNIEISQALLENPDDILRLFEVAIEHIDLPSEKIKIKAYVKNLPDSSLRLISSKRASDLKRLLAFQGVIRAKSAVLTRTTAVRFECPSCGNLITLLQNDTKIREPTRCQCGRRGKFKSLEPKEMIDVQKVEIEELAENVKGTSQPQRLKVNLTDSLIDPAWEPKFNPGAKVEIIGILNELKMKDKNGGDSVDSDYVLDSIYIENIEDEEVDLNITEKEMEIMRTIAKDENCIEKLTSSLIPSIYGHDKIKEGILVQLVGGVRKKLDDGTVKRGDIHILIIGDPGSGKSAMLQRIEKVVPHARVANGKGATGVGLTAAVIRDDFVGWTFAAGTLVLAHKNIAIIDEFDKMSVEDRNAIHEALEQQTVTLSKASIHARLNCECALLAGANPKYGRFDPHTKTIAEQINLPPTIINRFDLIFPVKDVPEPSKDEKTARKILESHDSLCCIGLEVDTNLLRKYLFYAKKLKPVRTKEATEKLINYYLEIRGKYNRDTGHMAIPISARQLEGLNRLSEAYAKLRLSLKISSEDAQRAICLMETCLREIATDPATGEIDIDKVYTGITTHQRGNLTKIKEIIENLEEETGKIIQIERIIEEASTHNISEEVVISSIERLKKSGDIFEPRKGYVSKV